MYRLIFFAILLLFIMPRAAMAEGIQAMRIGDHGASHRIVFEIKGSQNFAATVRDAPRRLEIYVPATSWNIDTTNRLSSPFRTIQHRPLAQDGLSRISLSLDGPHKIRNAYMLAASSSNPSNRLVIDIEPVGEPIFKSEINRQYGTLDIPNADQDDLVSLLETIAANTENNVQADAITPIEKPYKKPIIVIDPGHGGQDPGAISPGGIYEKKITLSLGKTLARILNTSGRYDARLTRTTDKYIKLYDRVKIARNADADLFISIHADSVGNKNTRGASVYTLSDTASDKQTAKLAARENRADIIAGVDLGVEDPDVSMILLDLSMRETMNQSKYLANTVVQSFTQSGVGTLKGPHRYAGFAVLKAPDVPSVLIETGFVSNETEARRLLSPAYQTKISQSILNSLNRYFAKD